MIKASVKIIEKDVDKIFEESEKSSKLVGEKILENAKITADTTKKTADRTIHNCQKLVKNDVLKRVSMASIELAKSHIKEELAKNFNLHKKLIEESINSLEEVEL